MEETEKPLSEVRPHVHPADVQKERVALAKLKKRMKSKAAIPYYFRDVEGSLWGVRDIRDTKHGFELLFGSPVSPLGSHRGGLPRLIVTQPLIDFFEANRIKRNGVLFDLPAGSATLKQVRRRFGFHYHHDLSNFWKEHIEDLEKLSTREIAARYNVDVEVAKATRLRMLGRRVRELGWFARTPGARDPAIQRHAEGEGREAGHLHQPGPPPQRSSSPGTVPTRRLRRAKRVS